MIVDPGRRQTRPHQSSHLMGHRTGGVVLQWSNPHQMVTGGINLVITQVLRGRENAQRLGDGVGPDLGPEGPSDCRDPAVRQRTGRHPDPIGPSLVLAQHLVEP